MDFPRSTRLVPLLLALVATAACGSDNGTEPEPQTSMAIVSGNSQTGDTGAALAAPVVVRLARDGASVQGASVAWTVASGGGSVSSATSTTDSNGLASTTWTLGAAAGANTLEASSAGAVGSPLTFSATATSGPPPNQASVTVGDFFFNASSTTVAVGGAVTWNWAGAAQHNVTFNSGGSDSPTQTAGTHMVTFNSAGTFDYQCTLHPAQMTGTVVVQ